MHRRINPKAIIFREEDNEMMLTNFDAIRVEAAIGKTMTRTSANSEDSQFVAPELQEGPGTNYKYKVDVYSVGMVMMYMATAVQQYTAKPDANWDAMEAFNKLSTCFANSKIYDMIVNALQADPNERTETSALASNDVFEGRL